MAAAVEGEEVEEGVAAQAASKLEKARMIIPQDEEVLEWNGGTDCPLMSGKMVFLREQQSPSVKHKKGEQTACIRWRRNLAISQLSFSSPQ